jgi:hypothetical protein
MKEHTDSNNQQSKMGSSDDEKPKPGDSSTAMDRGTRNQLQEQDVSPTKNKVVEGKDEKGDKLAEVSSPAVAAAGDGDGEDGGDDSSPPAATPARYQQENVPIQPAYPYPPYPYYPPVPGYAPGYAHAPPQQQQQPAGGAAADSSNNNSTMTGSINSYQYTDISNCGDPAPDTRRNRGGVTEPFPEKLHRMLAAAEREGVGDVVSFFSHGRAFAIHKPRRFVQEIMPRFFRQTRLTSFQRQLNLYGFRRISQGPDNGGKKTTATNK